jgi:hypothetical protein
MVSGGFNLRELFEMTIWQALTVRLGREPTNAEAKAECLRIIAEATREAAEAGRLPHQRKKGGLK